MCRCAIDNDFYGIYFWCIEYSSCKYGGFSPPTIKINIIYVNNNHSAKDIVFDIRITAKR